MDRIFCLSQWDSIFRHRIVEKSLGESKPYYLELVVHEMPAPEPAILNCNIFLYLAVWWSTEYLQLLGDAHKRSKLISQMFGYSDLPHSRYSMPKKICSSNKNSCTFTYSKKGKIFRKERRERIINATRWIPVIIFTMTVALFSKTSFTSVKFWFRFNASRNFLKYGTNGTYQWKCDSSRTCIENFKKVRHFWDLEMAMRTSMGSVSR